VGERHESHKIDLADSRKRKLMGLIADDDAADCLLIMMVWGDDFPHHCFVEVGQSLPISLWLNANNAGGPSGFIYDGGAKPPIPILKADCQRKRRLKGDPFIMKEEAQRPLWFLLVEI
jgi:hypothetical protein